MLQKLPRDRTRPHVLIACTGSVASIKVPEIVNQLSTFAHVVLLITSSAQSFVQHAKGYNPAEYTKYIESGIPVFTDQDEWSLWTKMGDPVLHIQLRDWADLLLIAPLSANTLGKLANGLCDNLVTCTARAWDFNSKPMVVAPAMNTQMWTHPFTAKHLTILRELQIEIIPPVCKTLACGETGTGALASVEEIVNAVKQRLVA